MKSYIFHTPQGWKWNKFPDKPDPLTYGRGQELIDALNLYDKQVAELKASALDVANPEIIPKYLKIPLTDGVHMCEWPGEVSIKTTTEEGVAIIRGSRYKKEGSDELKVGIKVAVLSLPKPEADLKNMETDNEKE